MKEPFHAGEIAVQQRLGVRSMASQVGNGIHGEVPAVARVFLREQRMLVVASTSADGAVWASLLTGPRGFVDAPDEHTLRVDAEPASGDPLVENLAIGSAVGLLAVDFATRRRVRVNGTVAARSGRGIEVRPDQVYGNCPKYIQRRELPDDAVDPPRARLVSDRSSPTAAQRAWVEGADTFFVATAHPERGADASHRGGYPGFVRFANEQTLAWPDYMGNMMFQTLGNLVGNPAAGLLFLDFARGATLQLTGKGRIVWEPGERPDLPKADRVVELDVERVVEIENRFPAGWRFIDYSPANPPV